MGKIDFESLFQTIKDEIVQLAAASAKQYAAQAKAEGLQLAEGLKNDILTWTVQIENGNLGKDDVTFLIEAKKDLIRLHALKLAGLAAITIDELVQSILKILTSSLLKII